MADFSAYLNTPVGEMKRVVLPTGHYYALIKDNPDLGESSGTDKHPMAKVQYQLQSCGEDVDQSQLPEKGIQGRVIGENFLLDFDFGRDSLRELIQATVDNYDEAQPLGAYINQLKGLPVLLQVGHRPRDKADPTAGTQEDIKKRLRAS